MWRGECCPHFTDEETEALNKFLMMAQLVNKPKLQCGTINNMLSLPRSRKLAGSLCQGDHCTNRMNGNNQLQLCYLPGTTQSHWHGLTQSLRLPYKAWAMISLYFTDEETALREVIQAGQSHTAAMCWSQNLTKFRRSGSRTLLLNTLKWSLS